ncbi:hypothetical protein CC86DRAFT_289754 [Ophiobolus disseminans]|uniref:N-acetyltransferase domain-containing protein n=1 Tax=Ophiobolus disseminans TaxID=1469910 RepID=A0A6A7A3G7_9PLEO|nr:hypothetical protein CC86DRAFT_289754 [Ophiobolus disseminans]
MSGPTASIPPHLRRKAAAAAAALTVAQSKAESSATNGSTATSDKSKTGQGIKLHSSPNGAGQVLTPPPSLPTTPRELEFEKAPAPQTVTKNAQNFGQIEDGGWTASWDTPKPEPTPVAPKKGNPRWPRIGGAPRKTVWPKNSEMRALPSESSSDGGVKCRSNSDGDPDYDVKKLMDWNGDWLPPPEQWSARKGHTSRHFGQGIEVWINDHGDECDKEITYDATTFSDDLCKELVPRYWLHTMVEQKPLGEFWKCMPSQTPYALSDVDMSEYPPFWERYEDESSCFIDGHEVPDARVDPGDIENHDPHGDLLASADVRVKAILEVREGKRRRTLMKQRRPPKEFKPAMPAMEDRRIQPKSNVYFRPVQPTDVEGIAAIYNHYVDHTIYANEFEGRSTSQISSRIDEVISNGLPYLVAIARGNQPRGPKGYVSEKIVGYINLDDHCDQSSMFRFTFELELYVHPGYLSQNIASCLLDRLLEMANTGYNACGGYEYRNDSQYLKTGPSRVIKTILLPVLKEQGEDIEKTSAFLKKFNFHLAGHVKQMGFKLGKVVDAYTYRHTTTEAIDPNSRPTVSLERD